MNDNSQAAVAAIQAMQKQLRKLEAENFELKREKGRLIKLSQDRESKRKKRNEKLSTYNENTSQLILSSSEVLSQLSAIRAEIEDLKSDNSQMENILRKEKAKQESLDEEYNCLKSDYVANIQRLNEYQSFLGTFLKLPIAPTAIDLNGLVILNSSENNYEALDDDLLEIYEQLEDLPKKFKAQSLSVKKKILQTYCKSHGAATNLVNKITCNEQQRFSSIPQEMSEETKKLYKEYYAIINEMKKFEFND